MRINRLRRARAKVGLTPEQQLDLVIGPMGAFGSPEERRRSWFQYRAEILALVGPGVRPAAFWEYEQKKLPGEKDPAALARLGLDGSK